MLVIRILCMSDERLRTVRKLLNLLRAASRTGRKLDSLVVYASLLLLNMIPRYLVLLTNLISCHGHEWK